MTTTQMSACPDGTGAGTPRGTDGVRPNVRPYVRPGVACWVQNQRPEPEVLVTASCGVCDSGSHPSHRNLGLELLPQSAHDRPRTRPHMDAKNFGGGF